MEPFANNQTKPNQTQTTPIARGIGRSRKTANRGSQVSGSQASTPALEAEERSRRQFRGAGRWVEENLPGEAAVYASSTYSMLRWMLKREPTVNEVRDRLVASGHDRESLNRVNREKGRPELP